MKPLTKLQTRLEKLGIKTEFAGNYPWIYLDKINGKKVTETFEGNHGFTVGFAGVKSDSKFQFTDIREIFKVIRKYAA